MTGTAVFVRLASRPIPRVTRMMRSAEERGLRPVFLGSVRSEGLPRHDQWAGYEVLRIGPTHPLLNGRRPVAYLTGILRFNVALLKELRRIRPALVHASDVETTPASIIYTLATGTPLLYNCHDNLADRYQLPHLLRSILNAVEGLVVLSSNIALVPEDFRRAALPAWCRHRINVVRNSPEDTGVAAPRAHRDGRVRILYAGWLDWGRGLAELLTLAEQHPWIEMWVAGEGNSEIMGAVGRSRATYLGYLDHSAVMAATREVDFVAAFYDPSRPINRAAAPNKLAEAFCTGRPVLTNEEVLVAQAPELTSCTLRVPYARIAELHEEIRRVMEAEGGARYLSMCQSARAVYDKQYSWLNIRRDVDAIYARLIPGSATPTGSASPTGPPPG